MTSARAAFDAAFDEPFFFFFARAKGVIDREYFKKVIPQVVAAK